jgi:hypothetical protein
MLQIKVKIPKRDNKSRSQGDDVDGTQQAITKGHLPLILMQCKIQNAKATTPQSILEIISLGLSSSIQTHIEIIFVTLRHANARPNLPLLK